MDALVASALQQQQQQIALQTQMSVLQKSMDVQKDLGNMIVGLIDSAAQAPGKALGSGANFDAFA